MIKNTRGFKWEAFFAHIEKHLGRGRYSEVEEIYYFGGGYWRGAVRCTEDGRKEGVSLINPSLTPEEIETVERAINLLP